MSLAKQWRIGCREDFLHYGQWSQVQEHRRVHEQTDTGDQSSDGPHLPTEVVAPNELNRTRIPAHQLSIGFVRMLVCFLLGRNDLPAKRTPVEAPPKRPMVCHHCGEPLAGWHVQRTLTRVPCLHRAAGQACLIDSSTALRDELLSPAPANGVRSVGFMFPTTTLTCLPCCAMQAWHPALRTAQSPFEDRHEQFSRKDPSGSRIIRPGSGTRRPDGARTRTINGSRPALSGLPSSAAVRMRHPQPTSAARMACAHFRRRNHSSQKLRRLSPLPLRADTQIQPTRPTIPPRLCVSSPSHAPRETPSRH